MEKYTITITATAAGKSTKTISEDFPQSTNALEAINECMNKLCARFAPITLKLGENDDPHDE